MHKRTILRITAILITLCVLFALSACGKVTEIDVSTETETMSETQTYSSAADTEVESIDVNTNRRLPSIPEELWDHVYLSCRDMGSCLKFCGRAAFLCVFVTDEESTWTEAEMDAAKLEFEKAAAFISFEAARYGAEAEAVLTYAEGKVEDPDAALWVDLLLEDAGYKSESWAREKVARDALAANGAVVLCYNNKDRSNAHVGISQSDVELVNLYECDSYTFVHETLHLFGAVDFYYPDEVKEMSKRILGDTIMREDVETVDSFTAYLVGWTDQISDEALEFLRETEYLTWDIIDEAHEYETYTGYVENRQYENYVYTGYLKNGVIDGKGKLVFDSGNVYEGDLVYGERHGYGTFTWTDGNVYEGEFTNDEITGKGTFSFANGNVYEGDFVNGSFSGFGIFTESTETVYEGEFTDGRQHGNGKLTFATGNVYEGEFVDGVISGYGVYRWTNGNVYEGNFENNTMNGYGTFTYSDGSVYSGTWSNGDFIG